MKKMKLFIIGMDWFAAFDSESALECWKAAGLDDSEVPHEAKEVSDEAMDRLRYHEGENYEDPSLPFSEKLNSMVADGVEFPCYFATDMSQM